MAPKKATSKDKPVKTTKSSKATATKIAAPKKAGGGGKKKGSEPEPFLPFKDCKYCFADFKDKELAAKIVQYGGSMTSKVSLADYVISEDTNSDKYFEALDLNIDTKSKENLESQIAQYDELTTGGKNDGTSDAHEIKVSFGKKNYVFRTPWFHKLGTVNSKSTDPFFAESEHPGTLVIVDDYDIATIEGSDNFSTVTRMQLVQDVDTKAYYLDTRFPFLQLLVSGDPGGMRMFQPMESKEVGIKAFEDAFKEKVGFVWKNRHTAKPKKGCDSILQFM